MNGVYLSDCLPLLTVLEYTDCIPCRGGKISPPQNGCVPEYDTKHHLLDEASTSRTHQGVWITPLLSFLYGSL